MPHCCRALRNASLVTSERRFPRGAPRLMVLSSRGVARNVAFQVSWDTTWRGTSCNPAACKSMITRRIFSLTR